MCTVTDDRLLNKAVIEYGGSNGRGKARRRRTDEWTMWKNGVKVVFYTFSMKATEWTEWCQIVQHAYMPTGIQPMELDDNDDDDDYDTFLL